MTCIVALKDNNNMYMASDRMVSYYEDEKDILSISKIFKPEYNILVGCSGSIRYSQIIQYFVNFNNLKSYRNKEIEFLIKDIVPQIVKYKIESVISEDDNGTILICLYNKIFEIDASLAVLEKEGFYAIGSGGLTAKASLFSTEDKEIRDRIKIAMNASSHFINSVSEEYDLLQYSIL